MRRAFVAVVAAGVATSCGSTTPAPQPQPFVVDQPPPGLVAPPAQETRMEPPHQTAQPQDLVFPEEEFRKTQPVAGPPRPFALPKVQHFTLASGIAVYLVEQHVLPLVSMDLNFDGGDRVSPHDKPGLVGTCMAMLTEGTDKLDKIAYAEALADIASTVTTYTNDDSHGVMLSSLTKHLDTTFELFAATLRSPGMRDRDFDRLVKRRIEAIKQAKGTPQQIAPRVIAPVLYGHAHPYGEVTTEASLAATSLDDCKRFAATWLAPKGARLFVVGDQTEAQIRARFEKSGALAGWAGAVPHVAALPAPHTLPGRIFFVDVPGAAQSQIAMLAFGPGRAAPDYYATTIMASVLGGGFASRINMNLREDKGYAYGARGGFSYTRDYGMFSATAGVQVNATYQSLLELRRELADMRDNKVPATADELDRERTGAILALPGRFSTAQAALGQYRNLVYFGLPLDYYEHYAAQLGKVGATEVVAAAKRHLPVDAVYVVVGDGSAKQIVRDDGAKKDIAMKRGEVDVTLRDALAELVADKKLGAGALVELDADGQPKH
jgi:zinc protease